MLVDQREFSVDAVGERKPVRSIFGGGEAETRSPKNARVEVDPALAVQGEPPLEAVGFAFDRRERRWIDEILEGPIRAHDSFTHFRAVVVGPMKLCPLGLETERPKARTQRFQCGELHRIFGREHPHHEPLRREHLFNTHIDCLPHYYIAYLCP